MGYVSGGNPAQIGSYEIQVGAQILGLGLHTKFDHGYLYTCLFYVCGFSVGCWCG